MSDTTRPDPTDPADPSTDEATKPKRDESFLAPDDGGSDEAGGSGGGEEPKAPPVPSPPD